MHQFLVEFTSDRTIARVDLNRPDNGNKLTRHMMRGLTGHLRELAQNEEIRAVVIHSRGSAFCEGRDGKGEQIGKQTAYETRQRSMGAVLDLYTALRQVPVPVVARVHGNALGFGAALAGACDLTLASASARFAFGEIHHGIPPTMAMTAVMRNVPPKALSWLIYSGSEISAQRAVEVGLASAVYADDEFDGEFEAFIIALAARPRMNLETIKKYQSLADGMSPDAASDYAGVLLALVRSS